MDAEELQDLCKGKIQWRKADICDRSEPVMLTQEAIDAIWEAQFKEYGQMCDSEDWNMFAASIEAASLRANGLKAPSI